MKKIEPLQLFTNSRVLEQDKKFHWVVSTSMFCRLSTGKIELMHDCISDVMETMGDAPMLDPGMPKPSAEWLVSGKFYSPQGKPSQAGQAKVQVEQLTKSLNVFGDRNWIAGIPSKPSLFISMPLSYELAFGAEELTSNPIGKGYKQDQLPNIEASDNTITDNHKRYPAAGFSPLDPSWPQRAQYQGSYDQNYMEKYFPGYPQDMDWRLFMNAPHDQWFDYFLAGTESFQFDNMHPEKPTIKGKLPGLIPRCFIKDTAETSTELQFKEVDLHLDTAWFFPDKDIVQLVWRGGMILTSDEAEQISHLILGYENIKDEKRSSSHYLNALETRIKAKDPLLNNLNTQDLIPHGECSAMRLLQISALENTKDDQIAKNLEAKSEAIQAVVTRKINSSISELQEKLDDPSIDKSLKDKVQAQLEQINTPNKTDSDSVELIAKLEEILPGINSKDPKKLDLSNFSFNKIDEIFEEIEKFMDKKKSQAFINLEPEMDQLKFNLEQGKASGLLDFDQQEIINQQIKNLESLIAGEDVTPALTPLPRLDLEPFKQQLAKTTPEIQKAQQELHLMLTNPLLADPEAIKVAKEKLDILEQGAISDLENTLLNAQSEFIKCYSMGAHFSDFGLSPHQDDDVQRQRLLSIINDDKNASKQDWACLDLSGLDLDGVDFSDSLMEQVNFTGASLVGTNFTGTILARTDFTKANCSHTKFDLANIGASTCQGTNFTRASFNECKLSKSLLENCDFSHTRINQPEVLELTLNHCDFTGSQIENWPFLNLTMTGNIFDQVKLTTCSFINSKLHDCSFKQATLPSTAWANTSLTNTSFNQANMAGNCFVSSSEIDEKQAPCYFDKLDFSETNLEKSNFQGLDFQNTNFSKAQIISCNFSSANLSNSNFDDCQGYQAQFRKARLSGVSMKRANLMEAILSKAIITDANLEQANLYGVDFLRATVKNTRFHNANLDATILRDWRPS